MEDEDLGEHSRKGENGEERPFKKARYVWQLKGKYHLKKHYKSSKKYNNSDSSEGSSKDYHQDNTKANKLCNDKEVRNSNVCNDRCYVDLLLERSDSLMESEDSREREATSNNIDRSISDEIPVSLVQLPKHRDELLYKWQARQVAKSFVDNTINTILEHCKLAPFDAADIIENCENGEQVEDEGILMAIQSHGLQSNTGNSFFGNNLPHYNKELTLQASYKPSRSNEMAPSLSTSLVKLQNIAESNLDNFENAQNEIVKRNSPSSFEKMSCEPVSEGVQPQSTNQLEIGDPMDFLNAAVSVAIQKKGLSSYNYG